LTAVICPFCAVGCQMDLLPPLREGLSPRFCGTPGHAVNDGLLCARGISAAYAATSPDRLTQPLWRAPGSAAWRAISWDQALDRAAEAIAQARAASWDAHTRSARSLVFWGGATAMNEEAYLFGRLARALGVVDLDHQARLCHSATTAALSAAWGFPAATHPWSDLAEARQILIIGANPAQAHPIADRWIAQARRRGASVVVVDPRASPSLRAGDLHLPIRPGTDVALLLGLVRAVLHDGTLDSSWLAEHTDASWLVSAEAELRHGRFGGWDATARAYHRELWSYVTRSENPWPHNGSGPVAGHPATASLGPGLEHPQAVLQALRRHVEPYHPEAVAEVCGVSTAQLAQAAARFCQAEGPGAVVYSMGLIQHSSGVAAVRALVILQALLGNLHRAGGGLFPLKGHANIQGATDVGGTFDLLPGYLPSPTVSEPTLACYGRRYGPQALGRLRCLLHAWYGSADAYARLPLRPADASCSLLGSLERMGRGEVTALVLLGQNPLRGTSNPRQTRAALRRVPFVLSLDPFLTETAQHWRDDPSSPCEVLALPTSSFLEKPGTRTNVTRRIEHQRAARAPQGEARPDALVLTQLLEQLRGGVHPHDQLNTLHWPAPSSAEADALYDATLREMAGYDAHGAPLTSTHALAHDGSTPCGCWIYAGATSPRASNHPGCWVWPDGQERLADPASPLRLWAAPYAHEPGLADGPFPTYYEPPGSPHPNLIYPEQPHHPAYDHLNAPATSAEWPLLLCVRISDQARGRCTPARDGAHQETEPLFFEVIEETALRLGLADGQLVRLDTPRAWVSGLLRVLPHRGEHRGAAEVVWAPAHWAEQAAALTPDLVLPDPGDPYSPALLVRGVPCRLCAGAA
jgi:formate dehydrogenase major subunit